MYIIKLKHLNTVPSGNILPTFISGLFSIDFEFMLLFKNNCTYHEFGLTASSQFS